MGKPTAVMPQGGSFLLYDGEKSGEDFWVKAEKLYYTALIGYIWYEAPDEEKNFTTLLEMINASEAREDDEDFKNPVDLMFERLEEKDPEHFAVKQYKKYKLAAGKTAKSILISCGARLAPFDIRELRELMETDEMELDTLGDRKTALFVIISDTDDTFNFVVSILYTQLFNLLCDKADDVYGALHMPRLKGVSFETAIIERYRRRESSVEEALIEMYLAGVSVRRVEDITEALWGSKVSPATISELNKKAYVHIEDWRNRPLRGGRYPYVYVDGIYLRRNWGGEYENVAILVAIAVNEDGFREVLGAAEGMKEDKASWVSFFQWLRGRGLQLRRGHQKSHRAEIWGEMPTGCPTITRMSMPTEDDRIWRRTGRNPWRISATHCRNCRILR